MNNYTIWEFEREYHSIFLTGEKLQNKLEEVDTKWENIIEKDNRSFNNLAPIRIGKIIESIWGKYKKFSNYVFSK